MWWIFRSIMRHYYQLVILLFLMFIHELDRHAIDTSLSHLITTCWLAVHFALSCPCLAKALESAPVRIPRDLLWSAPESAPPPVTAFIQWPVVVSDLLTKTPRRWTPELYGSFRFVIGVPPVRTSISRSGFSRSQKPSSELGVPHL